MLPEHKTWIPAHKTLTPARKTWTPAHKTSIRPEHNASPKFLKKKSAPLDTPSPGQSREENPHARLVSQRPCHRTVVFFRNLEIILGPSWNHLRSFCHHFGIPTDHSWPITDHLWLTIDHSWLITDHSWLTTDHSWLITDHS